MSLTDYLHPVDLSRFESNGQIHPQSIRNFTRFHEKGFPDLESIQLAILGVEEDRFHPSLAGCSLAADEVRAHFYSFIKPKYEIRLADLGNIRAGNNVRDTLFALNVCIAELLDLKIIPIVLGGSQDLAYAQFTAYQGRKHALNMAVCDAGIDLTEPSDETEYAGYLYRVITHRPNYLFNLVHLANQHYFVGQESLDAFEKMNFDLMRLGNLRAGIQEAEPLLRNADLLMMSMNSIRASDAPASVSANPNGLFGEEACQLMRYAGMGNDLSSIGIYDLIPANDNHGQTAKLAAQMIWYFMDGYHNRRNDYPTNESKDYMIYRTTLQNHHYEIVFYKHVYSERWWMEVPYPNEKSKQQGMFLVPCSYADYQLALKDEIPDRWMKAYQKLL